MSVAGQIEELEMEWSTKLAGNKQVLATFLNKRLADDFAAIGNLGNAETKPDVIKNCGPNGAYTVHSVTPPVMTVREFGDFAVVFGTDTVVADFDGQPVSGQFIWTDVWICDDGETWQCVLHHGSRIEPNLHAAPHKESKLAGVVEIEKLREYLKGVPRRKRAKE